MLTYGYLDKQEVIDCLQNRPANQHVVVTGRNASPELIEIADTVAELESVKHAFDQGIKVQKGVDY